MNKFFQKNLHILPCCGHLLSEGAINPKQQRKEEKKMAIKKEIKSVELLVSANVGINANGVPLKKDFAFKNINTQATSDMLYKHGTVLGSMMKHAKSGIYVREKHLLSEEKA
jgi:hypothetical protein